MAKPYKRRINFRKLASGILIGFIIFCLLSMAGSALIFRLIFGRNELSPDSLELSYWDIDPEKYPRSESNFLSGENLLQGYMYETPDSPGIIIIVHGINGGADSHIAETLCFIENGWSVFCFDGTGSRESEGNSVVGLSQMKLDLLAALDHVSSKFPDTPLLLYGHSMGAYASAAVLNDCPEIAGAVLLSGFDSPMDTMYYHASQYVGPLASLGYPFLWLHSRFLFGNEANESALSSINQVETPVLIVHGTEDEVIPDKISIYRKRAEITNSNASFLFVEDEYRNRHSSSWLSVESARYHTMMEQHLEELHESYGSNLPDSILNEFLNSLDRDKLSYLHAGFMDHVLSFYQNSIND